MSSSSDMTKAISMQLANQPSPPSDPNLDMMLQSLMIDDTNVKLILKGEIQEPLNRFRELLQSLSPTIVECFKTKTINTVQGNELIALLLELKPVLEAIEKRLGRYYHNVPYLLLLSPLVRLGNLDKKEVDGLCRKVGIMIGRDKLMAVGDESSFENLNFYDALYTLIFMALHESEEGWKMRAVTEEKRTVQTVIHDTTGQQRKKRFGIF